MDAQRTLGCLVLWNNKAENSVLATGRTAANAPEIPRYEPSVPLPPGFRATSTRFSPSRAGMNGTVVRS